MPIVRHPLCTDATLLALKDVPADEALIRRLEGSFRAMEMRGPNLADAVYERLFAALPTLRNAFPPDLGDQKRKFMITLSFLVANLRQTDAVRKAIRELGQRHRGYGVSLEFYPVFQNALLGAMSDVLGPAWTPELTADWSEALRLVGELMQEGARLG